ncbi:MAG TPA: PEP/pyruvate-binding domain-containing protein [Anaerolineales bacterium]|nr:PEP/pyruvate-binding domain-containing protein [Anaerolineales bacterium]
MDETPPSAPIPEAGGSPGAAVEIDPALADQMVSRAVAQCAEAHFAGDERRTRLALLRGQCEHCECVRQALVESVAAYLAEVDAGIKGVYAFDPPSAAAEDAPAPGGRHGIHIVVWVDRKSQALRSLAATLESALAGSQAKLGCPLATNDCYGLDMEIVDDRDVAEQRGFGLLVDRGNLQARAVWERRQAPAPAAASEAARRRFAPPEPFDPELMPEGRLLDHALGLERLPPEDRAPLEHHLTELKVTLIRRIISDQLDYINIAKQWLTVADLKEIYRHRIGFGRIGGKSAGMLLAGSILRQVGSEGLKACVRVPESFFLGSDLMYIFMAMNGLMHWNDQKYKAEEQIREDYPHILEDFAAGQFPPEILIELRSLLDQIGGYPVIVRSSSQLEDSLGTSFAGKYDSHFCPNQGSPQENLANLTRAIALTYASTFRPDALLYRRSKALQDYDERMAVLLQVVQGERWGRYFLPFGAGVGFSRNLYRWADRIRREDGFARLVWGLGTRAVERVGNDYPRLVALSHPTLLPDDSPQAVRYYSQHFVDLIDLEANSLKTLPIGDVLAPHYPSLPLLVQREQDGFFTPLRSRIDRDDVPRLAVTFDGLLARTGFPTELKEALAILEKHWHSPVDVEFTLHPAEPSGDGTPLPVQIALLQCRPLPSLRTAYDVVWPSRLAPEDVLLASRFLVPKGYAGGIRHVVFVDPERYFALPAPVRTQVGRAVSRLNALLPPKTFVCVGPGRWGTENPDLGVYVGYADICHAAALVELSGSQIGPAPEPSFGTHFFHDLTEAQIYSLAVRLDADGSQFNRGFFYDTDSCLAKWLAANDAVAGALRLIEVAAYRPGHHLNVIMDDDRGETLAYLAPDG